MCLPDPYILGPCAVKSSSSEHHRMLGITDVKPVTEQDTDLSVHAPEIVPVTHSELDFKHRGPMGGGDPRYFSGEMRGLAERVGQSVA